MYCFSFTVYIYHVNLERYSKVRILFENITCFVIVSTCCLYTRSAVVVSSRVGFCTCKKLVTVAEYFGVYCQCWFYFCSCLLLKVLMYSLNLMISLISVPSLASISHCYQINFLKLFFLIYLEVSESQQNWAESTAFPYPPCPRHARPSPPSVHPTEVPLLQSVHLHWHRIVWSPWFTRGGHLWHCASYEFGQMYDCAVIQDSLTSLKFLCVLCFSSLPSLNPWSCPSVNFLHSFVVFRMSYNWTHTLRSLFTLSSLCNIHLRFIDVLSWLNSSFLFSVD